jgi:cytochrome c-type biogenesis protein CcmH
MNVFIGIATLMTVLVAGWMVLPLLRSVKTNGVTSDRLNVDIHRDQLQALQIDLARGVISQADFETTRDELQLRLLDDTESFDALPASSASGFWTSTKTAVVIGLSTPVMALGIYLQLGTPAAIDPVVASKADEQQIKQMLDTLSAKLKANPDNPKGWAMLARSYKVLGRFDEAEQAFVKAGNLTNTEPDLLVDYADLLAVKAGNNLEGKPLEMVTKALTIDPKHPMGLMMSGVAAYQRSDFKTAIVQWEKLLAELEPGSPDAQQVLADISNAREKAGMPATTSNPSAPKLLANADSEAGKLPPVPAGAAGGMTPEMINQMVERLANRLKDNPDDLAGWAKLARAYKVQGKLAEAEQAYTKAGKFLESDADLLTQFADLLATRANGNFKDRPLALINKALAINPTHPMALMMAGQAAFQSNDFKKAITHWEKVLTVLPSNSADAIQVSNEIEDAKSKLSTKK